MDPPALHPAPGRGAGYVYLGVVTGEPTPADIPHVAPVRLEICLLNIGGSPEQEWPIEILPQEVYESGVWFKDLSSPYIECRLSGGHAALQRAACLPCPVSGAYPRAAPLAGPQPLQRL